ncbi:MerR family transcriptional regulator [Listeria sp. FSL L7-0091]|uniref:MerR family transcriptional regulator n=1 Tax=Listeria farberi TaxID=2713500 RepID=UPI001627C3B3|nr:MerR family transcriptional regulator [Listeria farberi]
MSGNYKIQELYLTTLRYYKRLGVLKPKRNRNNYRIFTNNDLKWIKFIQRVKATGRSLSKIVDYSVLRAQGCKTINERIEILEKQEQILCIEKNIITH